MCDFAHGQILTVKNIYPNSLLNFCFFHFSQIIWKRFNKYRIIGKRIYEFNSTLLFNLHMLCFIKLEQVNYFFTKIKNKFDKNENTKKIFTYFNRNWLKTKYPIKLWNYFEKLKYVNENEIVRYIFTNNINENINKSLNYSLLKSRASYDDFIFSLEQFEKQFSSKLENS